MNDRLPAQDTLSEPAALDRLPPEENLPSRGSTIPVTPAASRGTRGLAPDLAMPMGLLTKEIVAQVQEHLRLLRELKVAILASTFPGDWMDFDGKPYLKDSGIQAVAGAIGLEFDPKPVVREESGEDSLGKWTRFEVEQVGTWRGRKQWDIGSASTRDPFFSKAKGALVPYEEIDLGDVKKKAITNAQHRILVKLFGIGGVTWEQLAELGVTRGAGGTPRFKGQERARTTGGGAWTPKKERLWGLLLELNGAEEAAAAEALFRATDNPTKGFRGTRDPRTLSDRTVDWLLPRVEREWEGQDHAGREPGSDEGDERGPGGPP